MTTRLMIALVTLLISGAAIAAPSTAEKTQASDASVPTGKGVKYKGGKDVNFEELLIQGQLKRAEITVVTGNVDDGTNGLLRLREDFLDRMTADAGEEMTDGVK
jgi:hypothetical protein